MGYELTNKEKMNNSTEDPDFEVASSVGDRASYVSNTSSARLLRSSCHHLGPCHEGHGIQFNSRISPSPSRSNTSYTRRRRVRHKSRLSLESSPEEVEEQEKSPKISSNRNVNNSSRKSSHKSLINAKRNLTEEFTGEEPSKSPRIKTPRISRRNLGEELALQEPSIQRTTSWVADLAKSTNELLEGATPIETRT